MTREREGEGGARGSRLSIFAFAHKAGKAFVLFYFLGCFPGPIIQRGATLV